MNIYLICITAFIALVLLAIHNGITQLRQQMAGFALQRNELMRFLSDMKYDG